MNEHTMEKCENLEKDLKDSIVISYTTTLNLSHESLLLAKLLKLSSNVSKFPISTLPCQLFDPKCKQQPPTIDFLNLGITRSLFNQLHQFPFSIRRIYQLSQVSNQWRFRPNGIWSALVSPKDHTPFRSRSSYKVNIRKRAKQFLIFFKLIIFEKNINQIRNIYNSVFSTYSISLIHLK